MTNAPYALEEYKDIEIVNLISEWRELGISDEKLLESVHAKGRDNARTPMHWDASEKAGFTTGEPWIKINPNHIEINAADQVVREDSVFSYYKKLIALRKREEVICNGDYSEIYPSREDLFAYTRDDGKTKLTVVANFTENTISFPKAKLKAAGELEICNYADAPVNGQLRPYEARIYIKK